MATESKGIVYLIGAGPGDPELITVKALRLLRSCDAVVYDNLVADEIVVGISADQEAYYVGKKPGAICHAQEDINALIARLALEGKRVARLKGADPLIFGRGGEEARYLKEQGIPFEIVPGITAGIAAPAYSGIPCTDRQKASFVMFVTGHKAKEKTQTSVPWEWVAKAQNGTIVIYMGVAQIDSIVSQLIENGMDPAIPAAVIERGTYPSQRHLSASLSDLPRQMRREQIKAPAIVVVGEVVTLQPWLEWYGHRPLAGARVMVTRPSDQAAEMYERLRELGAEVMPFPTIETQETVDKASWKVLTADRTSQGWLVFTSENGVRYFMKQFLEHMGDVRQLGRFKIAAVGHGTARALKRYHLETDFVPSKATTDILAQELSVHQSWKGVSVIRVRGNLSHENVEKSLSRAGAAVLPLDVYRTNLASWPEHRKEDLIAAPPDYITFTSGTTVEGLFHNLQEELVEAVTRDAILVSIGPSTSRLLNEHGLRADLEAKVHSVPAIIDLIREHAMSSKDER